METCRCYEKWSYDCELCMLSCQFVLLMSQDEDGNTPLHTAIHVGCHGAVERLTAQPGLDFQLINNRSANVLQLAVIKRDIVLVINPLRLLVNYPSSLTVLYTWLINKQCVKGQRSAKATRNLSGRAQGHWENSRSLGDLFITSASQQLLVYDLKLELQ